MRSAGRASKTEKLNEPHPELWPKELARIAPLELRRSPLLAATCWFAVGELIARNRPLVIILSISTLSLFLLTLAALRWSLRTAVIPLAAAWMAIGCLCSEIHLAPPAQPALASYADGLSRQIRGRIIRVRSLPPVQRNSDHDSESGWEPGKEADDAVAIGLLSVDIEVDSIEEVTPDVSRMVPIKGGVRLSVIRDNTATKTGNNSLPVFSCGDEIEAPMRIKLPERYRDPGAWQYSDYLLAQGISAHASVRSSKITFLGKQNNGDSSPDFAAESQCRLFAAQELGFEQRLIGYVNSNAKSAAPSRSAAKP